MRENFDEYVLSYMVLRIDAGLNSIINPTGSNLLGQSRKSIRGQWPSVRQKLKRLAKDVITPRYVDWGRAASVGLTDKMLDLKRETLDRSLGRDPIPNFHRKVKRAASKAWIRRRAWFYKDILVEGGSAGSDKREAFFDLAKELLGSIAKILKLDDAADFIKEFMAVVEAAMKMTGNA